MTMKTSTNKHRGARRAVRALAVPAALLLAAALGGCVYAPPYGYAPAPVYPAYGYGYGPGYYAAPSVAVGVGFGGGGGHWHGR